MFTAGKFEQYPALEMCWHLVACYLELCFNENESVLQMIPQGSVQCTHSSMVVKSCFMCQHFFRGPPITDNRYVGLEEIFVA